MARLSALSLASVALFGGGVEGVLSIYSAGASTPRAAAPHIVARPHGMMVNGSIKLIGTHFKPRSTLTIKECSLTTWVVVAQDPCDTTNSIVVKTKGRGQFTSSFTVQTCPVVAASPPGFSQTCYIGDPTPSGVGAMTLVGAVTITVTGPSTPSPLIWGTNLAMFGSSDQFLANAGAEPALAGLHAQLVRMPIRDTLTSTDYSTALNKIKQMGATPLIIVHGATYGSDPYPPDSALMTLAKAIFPTQTVYVDFGNEEDLAGASVTTYVSGTYGWDTEIPRLKAITGSNFLYGGPVNFNYNESYITTFAATASPKPNYVVWHAYAGSCGHRNGTGVPDSQAHMLASITDWGAHIQQINTDLAGGMPIVIDEWNYASDLGVSGSASPCYSADQSFINQFFASALNTFVASHILGAAEYEAFLGTDENMLTSTNTPTYQGTAFSASYVSWHP